MSVTEDIVAAGFIASAGSKAGGVGYEMEQAPTLKAQLTSEVVYCIQGNCIDRADTARCNGKGVRGGQTYTLNTIDRHAVAYKKEETHDKDLPTSDMQLHPVHRV